MRADGLTLAGDEGDELADAFLHALLGLFCDFSVIGKSILHNSSHWSKVAYVSVYVLGHCSDRAGPGKPRSGAAKNAGRRTVGNGQPSILLFNSLVFGRKKLCVLGAVVVRRLGSLIIFGRRLRWLRHIWLPAAATGVARFFSPLIFRDMKQAACRTGSRRGVLIGKVVGEEGGREGQQINLVRVSHDISIVSRDCADVVARPQAVRKKRSIIEAVLVLRLQLRARSDCRDVPTSAKQPRCCEQAGLERSFSKKGTVYRLLDAMSGNQIRQVSCKGFDCDDGGAWFECVVLVRRVTPPGSIAAILSGNRRWLAAGSGRR